MTLSSPGTGRAQHWQSYKKDAFKRTKKAGIEARRCNGQYVTGVHPTKSQVTCLFYCEYYDRVINNKLRSAGKVGDTPTKIKMFFSNTFESPIESVYISVDRCAVGAPA